MSQNVDGVSADDPLALALRPPPDEAPDARARRLEREADARRVSQAIDDAIRAERAANKKKKIVRVLLLGQSESGKSTTLRQFQRIYTPSAFREDRIYWRSIIQLNLIRSVHTILAALAAAPAPLAHAHHPNGLSNGHTPALAWDEDAEDLEQLAIRLLPLRHAEALLKAKLVPSDEEEPVDLGAAQPRREVSVRPGRWRGLLRAAMGGGGLAASAAAATATAAAALEPDVCQRALCECREAISALWASPRVRTVLAAHKVRLEEESGFFLDDVERIARPEYVPTDDDVLRARLKTVGVSEYKFEMEAGGQRGTEWRIVDVGGSRFQRPTWAPFFDDVDAIIFLAPISAFDQVLLESVPARINRLEDSVLLWKAICSNRLLAHVDLVLFLNKCDILQRKLDAGIPLARYVKSYGDRPNDVEAASKYFRTKFAAIQRASSPLPRKFYGFCTSVTDTASTSGILASVRDIVLRQNLRHVKLA
ncbi:guanine nucleotide binding protein, alpha subunit [Vararia minispora EC-137]|uniref:Guanine nucleotide binding protein, alpha subunit n=1 Tax=Vararia minispora EC-137 TaxID=1314806 RepID=A0ACB8Q4S7_9AGAM|nr:guanine nucleotide binding protein, alpha subunit [Vararia minispora EC-137]